MRKLALSIFIAALIGGVFIVNGFSLIGVSANIFSSGKENGVIKVEKRQTANFKAVDIGGTFDAEIVAGKEFSVEVEGDEALLPLVRTEVYGDTLEIGFHSGWKLGWWKHKTIKLRISMPEIEKLEVSGASKANVAGIKAETFSIDLSGASSARTEGESKELKIEVSGASKVDAANLKSETVSVDASGACNVEVFASKSIDADASGASKITYSGDPETVKKDTSGASSVKKK